ncbi:MAG TPA: sensor domain-containing diguanylate cyclase [Acetobacterium sp.]
MRDQALHEKFKLKEGQYTIIENEHEGFDMKKYQILFEKAVESIMVIQNQEIKIANPKSQELTGYNTQDLISMHFLDLFSPEDSLNVIIFHRKRFMGEKENTKLQVRLVKKNKEIRWVEFDGIKILWNDQPAILNLMIDITDRKKAVDALKQSEEKYRLLTEYASDVIWALNLDKGRFTYISPGILQLRGYTVEEAMNQSLEESLAPKSLIKFNEEIRKNLDEFGADPKNPKNYISEIQQFCKDGSIIWIEVSMKYRVNSDGEIEIVGVSRDIHERKKADEDALILSYFDQLTGLHNRSFYEQELIRLNTEKDCPMSLILVQLNGLKTTNDTFGVKMGDKLLVTIAKIMKNVSRAVDSITRISGAEFVLLLPKTNGDVAELIVKRMKDAIDKNKMDEIILSVSFGWATKNHPEEHLEKMFIEAQDMLNLGKK